MTASLQRRVLTMNRGSSTLKSALYEGGNREELLLSVTVDESGVSGSHLKIEEPNGTALLNSPVDSEQPNAVLEKMFAWLDEHGFLSQTGSGRPPARPWRSSIRGTATDHSGVLVGRSSSLCRSIPTTCRRRFGEFNSSPRNFPNLPQVACFDTAFHRSLPKVARMYALPRAFYDQGIVRYGFHGLSYEYIMRELQTLEGEGCQRTRDYCSSRQRRQHGCGQRGKKRGHVHGFHPA